MLARAHLDDLITLIRIFVLRHCAHALSLWWVRVEFCWLSHLRADGSIVSFVHTHTDCSRIDRIEALEVWPNSPALELQQHNSEEREAQRCTTIRNWLFRVSWLMSRYSTDFYWRVGRGTLFVVKKRLLQVHTLHWPNRLVRMKKKKWSHRGVPTTAQNVQKSRRCWWAHRGWEWNHRQLSL